MKTQLDQYPGESTQRAPSFIIASLMVRSSGLAIIKLFLAFFCAATANATPTDPHLFFAEASGSSSGIYSQNLTSGVTTRISSMAEVTSLALDSTNDHLYVARLDLSSSQHEIVRMDLEAGHEVIIATNLGPDPIWGMALHVPNQQIYFTTYHFLTSVRRIDFDGANLTDLISGLRFPHGIDIDRVRSKLYFVEYGYGDLKRANLDGTSVETIANKADWEIAGVTVDANDNKIYFTPFTSGPAYRADLDGSNEAPITPSLGGASVIRIHPPTSRLYYCAVLDYKISRSDTGGSNQELLHNLNGWTMALDVSDGLNFPSDPTATTTPPPLVTPTIVPPEGTLTVTILDSDGHPLPGAVVTIQLLGSFISNNEGKVTATRLPKGIDSATPLIVRAAKDGHVFTASTVIAGQTKTLTAAHSDTPTTDSCSTVEFKTTRATISHALTELYLNAYEATEQARQASNARRSRAFERQFKSYRQALVSLLSDVQRIELMLPTQSVSCSHSTYQCRKVSMLKSLRRLLSCGNIYLRITSHTTRAMTNLNVNRKRVLPFLAKARWLQRALSAAVNTIPTSAGRCE